MSEINDLSVTDASNTARFPEGQSPASLNNAARALEGILAREYKDTNGSLTLAGTSAAYTVALNRDTGLALYDGLTITAEVNTVNTSTTPTLTPTPDGGAALATDTITKAGGIALSLGDMQAGMFACLRFDGTNWELLNPGAMDANLVGTAVGVFTNANHPAFLAYNSADDANVTGDGTVVTIDFDTEVFDRGGNFAADTFTAPVTGLYQFSFSVLLSGLTTSEDEGRVQLVTSNRTYRFGQQEVGVTFDQVNTALSISGTILADMDASDTAIVQAIVLGGTKIVDIAGSGSTMLTFFSGHLVA